MGTPKHLQNNLGTGLISLACIIIVAIICSTVIQHNKMKNERGEKMEKYRIEQKEIHRAEWHPRR